MTERYHGSCLCGQVTFAASELNPKAGHCHCTMCRKFHGAAFSTLAAVAVDRFEWLTGESRLKHYRAANGTRRTFCGDCGSSLAFSDDGSPDGEIEIALGAFDDDIPIKPDVHIYTAFGANWYSIEDDLPRFEEARE